MDPKVAVALALSLIGGLSTSLGALLAILNCAPNNKTLGILQGFATGLMLSMSFFDLAYDAVNAIGFLKGNLWFFAGALLFSTIAEVFPEQDCKLADENDKHLASKTGNNIAGKELMMRHRRRVIFSVIVTAIVAGVSLQNFPVGTAAFLGTTKGFRVGLNLALAIALHYIPEVIDFLASFGWNWDLKIGVENGKCLLTHPPIPSFLPIATVILHCRYTLICFHEFVELITNGV
ncbi:hypothetical protein E2562_020742 [Oryza meyeriana var. granulata]|uniref:Uncharacterized protein n=1 Tax=Oryza meyeriana var. granulata TaxID=110450 RepID=A0A6G1CH64_9ORYZ|nr:hypothetical protein E2562_020742 [Oryza meyeriana var. granulata]KAF0899532.1 hypothetical protein E2562_020742 [Oryza meyeriana var. granulata]KAF0899533.1 hypothetical protein E2562_020742 [Oryza meyeriana var. granulata]KAF0899534.1 hypothetical protein E2562_020742 [Oryza meyeriana var. granulata]KAF0899535.1 hypothetical protein E2562_020742 [Oryza meyeriana var. granulata]